MQICFFLNLFSLFQDLGNKWWNRSRGGDHFLRGLASWACRGGVGLLLHLVYVNQERCDSTPRRIHSLTHLLVVCCCCCSATKQQQPQTEQPLQGLLVVLKESLPTNRGLPNNVQELFRQTKAQLHISNARRYPPPLWRLNRQEARKERAVPE
jgi:hypothetical protein